MEGGTSCSGIDLTSPNLYDCYFKDKTIALLKSVNSMAYIIAQNYVVFRFLMFYVKIAICFPACYRKTCFNGSEKCFLNLDRL